MQDLINKVTKITDLNGKNSDVHHVHGLEFNCMSINPKLIYRFKVIPIKM